MKAHPIFVRSHRRRGRRVKSYFKKPFIRIIDKPTGPVQRFSPEGLEKAKLAQLRRILKDEQEVRARLKREREEQIETIKAARREEKIKRSISAIGLGGLPQDVEFKPTEVTFRIKTLEPKKEKISRAFKAKPITSILAREASLEPSSEEKEREKEWEDWLETIAYKTEP